MPRKWTVIIQSGTSYLLSKTYGRWAFLDLLGQLREPVVSLSGNNDQTNDDQTLFMIQVR